MKTLVLGSGGREHALAWRLRDFGEVIWAPGNPGALRHGIATLDMSDPLECAKFVQPDLIVIGPENPLIEGLADALRAEGFAVVGPGARGAKLEASKAWSKEMMLAAGVPTAASAVCTTPEQARAFARARHDRGLQVVIKASGAALGKGVIVTSDLAEADDAIAMMIVDREFGDAGATVVVEDRLGGFEFSLLTLVNGRGYQSLPVAQDYKRALDGDRGPNTGGMGTYSPVPAVTADVVSRTEELVVAPLLAELEKQGISYRGVLFSGLMMDGDSIQCLEYNVRFGDPETQSVMRRLGPDFGDALLACANNDEIPPVAVSQEAAVTVVMAAGGYPGQVQRNIPIHIPSDMPEEVEIFHAGTAMQGDQLVSSGGRVLGVSAVGADVAAARATAYRAVAKIESEGLIWRTDIGARG
ncbi:MAG: phosphoribosylamine--glycine ligase [Chthonomonas sp.]|nr:phosphoribosylamine--glycine ligase [Chthonomonas sp.]